MVCSRCGQEGHRRNNHRCLYFYTNPNFRSTRTHPVPTGPDQPVPRVASIPANNSPPILVRNGPNYIAYSSRIIIPAITRLMQKLETLFTRTESLIRNNEPDQYTTTRDPATIHDELNQMNDLYHVLYPVIRNQMMDFETNMTNNIDSLTEGYTGLLGIDRELNLFILMTFNYECGEWIRSRPRPPQRVFTQVVVPTPRTLSVLMSIETENQSTTQCSICFDEKEHSSVCLTDCNHDLCVECMCQYINSRHGRKELPCPLCRSDIKNVICHGNDEYKMLCDTRDQTPNSTQNLTPIPTPNPNYIGIHF